MSSWAGDAERDLILAVLTASSSTPVRPDWAKTQAVMLSWGYTFSKDSLASRWSKRILKAHKQRVGGSPVRLAAGSSTSTPKRKKPVDRASSATADADSEGTVDNDLNEKHSAKRPRRATRLAGKERNYEESEASLSGNEISTRVKNESPGNETSSADKQATVGEVSVSGDGH